MAIQILGGIAKGFPVQVIDHRNLRPTSVMLRRRLFDANQDLSNYIFFDLCAGTGTMGMEAWSRGASRVYLSEKDKLIYKNLLIVGKKLSEKYPHEMETCPIFIQNDNFVNQLKLIKGQYLKDVSSGESIIYFDPPYENHSDYCTFIKFFQEEYPDYKGQLWLEADSQKTAQIDFENIFPTRSKKSYRQGTSFVTIFR